MTEHPGEQILAALLRSLGVGTDPVDELPWPVFALVWPNDPDEIVGIHDMSMKTDGRIQRTGETLAFEGVQIRVRSKKLSSASKQIRTIALALDEVLNDEVSVEHTRYEIPGVHQLRTPAYIGEDENDRKEFTLDCKFFAKEV